MSTQFEQLKVLEQCHISPPSNSLPITSKIPLTFFDIGFLCVHPAQSLFLYKTPFSSAEFTQEILPQLKNSLSLALHRFFPLFGNCVCPPHPSEPYIFYNDGDSAPLLVAQCDLNFSDFLLHGPTDARQFRLLVPLTLPKRVLDDTLLVPLLAVQVTLFPNAGICIGITHHHVAGDGMSIIHFAKTWASIFKSKCDMSNVYISLPAFDKGFIKDPDGIKDFHLNHWRAQGSPICNDTVALTEDCVRAIFTFTRFDIDRLKKWISAKCYDGRDTMPKLYFSSFVAISAFIWVCLIKTLDRITNDSLKDGELCHFCVVADCRDKYGLGIPATFFGNCLIGKLVSVARSKFRQEDCVATVAEVLSQCVQSFKEEAVVGDLNEFPKWEEALAKGEHILTVTSTPKQAAYQTDFGWGCPERIEAVHIDTSGSVSLSQSRDEEGGIEVGLCRSRREMEIFKSIFEAGMDLFRYRVML